MILGDLPNRRHFGVLCPPISGHLNPMMTLCRELQGRGHRVTLYLLAYGRKKAEGAGFNVHVFGEDVLPASATTEHLRKLGELSGRKALDHTRDFFATALRAALRDLPGMLKEQGVDAMLADQTTTEGPTLAEGLGIPYFIICNAMTLYRDPAVPPFFTTWPYSNSLLGRLRNRAGEWIFDVVRKPITRILNDHRQSIGLVPYHTFMSPFPPLAHISQQPREFEFPRRNPPANLHYVGPMHDARVREASDFPFDRLDGRPLVYASMGTLQNRVRETFGTIAEACADLPVQVVISLGGGASVDTLGKLPGDPIAVGFAPQLELLKRSTLCVTHAGLNTVLEALSVGVPLVAIPIANDQPGVAARLAWTGAGLFIRPKKLTAPKLRELVRRVLTEPSFKQSAERLRKAIARNGGAKQAGDLIESALAAGASPVPSPSYAFPL